MASVDASINVVVNNINKLKELEDKLKGIEETIQSVSDLFSRGVTGRSTQITDYIRVLQELGKSARQTAQEGNAIRDVNDRLRQRIILESQLRREQSRTARLSRSFEVETRGLDQTAGSLKKIKQQFDEISEGLKQAFKIQDIGLVSQLRNELSALLEDQREYNRVLAGSKNTGIDADFLKEQAKGYKLQVDQLRKRANALKENEEILRRLKAAEFNLVKQRTKEGTFTSFADPRLGREILKNVEAQINAEERLARERQKGADAYAQQQKNIRREVLQTVNAITGTAKKFAGATFDALTFGKGAEVARGTKNAAIRGGVGLGALGIGKLTAGLGAATTAAAGFAMQGPQSIIGGPIVSIIEKFAQVLNSAMGGIPQVVADALQAIGQIPDSLGLAAVAAFALAPEINKATKSVFNLGKAAGNFAFSKNPVAKFLNEINPAAAPVFGTVQALTDGLDKLRGKALDLDEVRRKAQEARDAFKQPLALPPAGQTSFAGPLRQITDNETLRAIRAAREKGVGLPGGPVGTFVGGGARVQGPSIINGQEQNRIREFLTSVSGDVETINAETRGIAARTQDSADEALRFAQGLEVAAQKAKVVSRETKTIADYLEEAQALRQGRRETSTQSFIRRTVELGREQLRNQTSADIARERSKILVGAQYSISEVPIRGELFPGGRTETRQPMYREMLNTAAKVAQLQQEILDSMSKQQGFTATIGQLERRTVNDRGQSLRIQQQENKELQKSIEIIRQRNRELRQRPIAAMTPQERVAGGILDPASLRQSRLNRVMLGRQRQEAGKRAFSEGLIGGAFPLLFGQGVGASVLGGAGGAAGGFMGGSLGFGLSLLGTALGSAIDNFNNNLKSLASSLKDPTASLEAMKTAGLRVTQELEFTVQSLEAVGRSADAQRRVFEELERQLGAGSINQLRAFNEQQKELDQEWQQLAGTLAGLLLPALTGTIAIVNDTIDGFKSLSSIKLPGWLQGAIDTGRKAQIGIGSIINPGFGLSYFYAQNAINRGKQEAAGQPAGPVPLSPEKQLADLDKAIQTAQELRSIQQQGIQLERQASDLNYNNEQVILGFRQRAANLEKEAADFRRSIEDQIFSKRQELARVEIENERKKKQNAIEIRDLELQKLSQADPTIGTGFIDAVRQYLRVRGEGEANLQQRQKETNLDIQQIEREVANFRLQAEDRMAKLAQQRDEFSRDVAKARIDIERSIYDYGIQLEDYRNRSLQYRYQQEVDLINKRRIAEEGLLNQSYGGGGSIATIASRNLTPAEKALLATIRFAEGTSGPQGYRTMFGGGLFSDMSRHPDTVVRSGGYVSAAAGAYQFMPGTWQSIGGGAMSPQRQDAAAILLSQRRGVDINTMGFTPQVAARLAPEWASFPTLSGGSYYGQPVKSFNQLKNYFDRAFAQFSAQGAGGQQFDFSTAAARLLGNAVANALPPAQAAPQPATQGAAAGVAPLVAQPMAAPPAAPVAPAASYSFPTAPALIGINDLLAQNEQITASLVSARKELLKLDEQSYKVALEREKLNINNAAMEAIRQSQLQTKSLYEEVEARRLRNRLAAEGVNEEEIQGELRVLELRNRNNDILRQQDITIQQQISVVNALLKAKKEEELTTYEATLAKLAELDAAGKLTRELAASRDVILQIIAARKSNAEGMATEVNAIRAQATASQLTPTEKANEIIGRMKKEIKETLDLVSQAEYVANSVANAFSNSFESLITGSANARQALGNFFGAIAQDFARMAANILAQQLKMLLFQQLLKALGVPFAGGGGGGIAGLSFTPDFSSSFNPSLTLPGLSYGGAFDNGVTPFAMGGSFTNSIVKSPTLFKFADGAGLSTGVMGEAGPEAIMPLKRGPGGRLGVEASGGTGSSVNVVVNVDAKGSSVQGNEQSGNQLGRVIAAAVQQELVRQQRPGGILSR